MLPAVMGLYELFLAARREWKRQIPFLAVSLWFGVQALLSFRGENTEYSAAGSAGALWVALEYCAARILLIPGAGLAFFAAPFLFKDRRLAFGCVSFWALLLPMLMLPRHLNDAYLYVPMLSAAVAMAALFQQADRHAVAAVAIFFAVWLPLDYRTLRAKRAGDLHEATENRAYVSALIEYSKTRPEASEFLFETSPLGMPAWGIESALRYLYPPRDIRLRWIATDRERTSIPPAPAAFLGWDAASNRLHITSRQASEAYPSFFRMNGAGPVWALIEGWHSADRGFRWSARRAAALLQQPAAARVFRMRIILSAEQAQRKDSVDVRAALDGVALGTLRFRGTGSQAAELPLTEARERLVRVEFSVPSEMGPPTPDPRGLGVAVESFGFVTQPERPNR
jgi:hypothetical protein